MLIQENFEGHAIAIRQSDKYWNLTLMCQVYGKRIDNFLRLKETKEFLKVLAEDVGISASELIKGIQGGNSLESGTWGHELVALELAGWLNVRFKLWAWKVVIKLLTEGEVKLEGEILEGLKAALELKNKEIESLRRDNNLKDYRLSVIKSQHAEEIFILRQELREELANCSEEDLKDENLAVTLWSRQLDRQLGDLPVRDRRVKKPERSPEHSKEERKAKKPERSKEERKAYQAQRAEARKKH